MGRSRPQRRRRVGRRRSSKLTYDSGGPFPFKVSTAVRVLPDTCPLRRDRPGNDQVRAGHQQIGCRRPVTSGATYPLATRASAAPSLLPQAPSTGCTRSGPSSNVASPKYGHVARSRACRTTPTYCAVAVAALPGCSFTGFPLRVAKVLGAGVRRSRGAPTWAAWFAFIFNCDARHYSS